MRRLFRKRSKKTGLPPGTPIHIGEKRIEKTRIRIIEYDKNQFQEEDVKSVDKCFPLKMKPTTTWINLDGIHQVEIMQKIGNHLGLHPLTLEDIVNTEQRPKMEDFGDYIFLILKMFYLDTENNEIRSEQVSMVLGPNYVISFQEGEGDVFDPIRERIRTGKGRVRAMEADYLAYALIDIIVDNYFAVLERLEEEIDDVEDELIADPAIRTLQNIHRLKRDTIFMRKSVWPLRETISKLGRQESSLVHESTEIYLRDVYDHTIQIIDVIETYRDMLSGMLDIYLSSLSNRMNEVMKVLTIIATIFIPLTFIVGLYGMNFVYMPELEWFWGYPVILLTMLVIGILMVIYFRIKKWL
ncbi:MAG: magnesium/cobalt transporter CorA [Promethearchaeota archaeon]